MDTRAGFPLRSLRLASRSGAAGRWALFAAWVALASTAWAEWVIVQKVDGLTGQTGEATLRIKEGKVRADLPGNLSMISNKQAGEIVTLKHEDRTALRISPDQARLLGDRMRQALAGSAKAPAKPVNTGRKEEVAGHATQVFTYEVGELKATYWIAPDYPDGKEISEQLAALQGPGAGSLSTGLEPTLEDLPGLRLKTEVELRGKKVTTTITAARRETLDPKIFEVPKDYREVSMDVPKVP